ncbi:hypothetical protein GCM10009821_20160 [Aeromicrobium halocynthiae]|uniref:Uncharacterized protein n=1 Tax=Aeromicrobium halocynthiae TaxID=560557 RepID=A0ABN2W4I7_9ACTN
MRYPTVTAREAARYVEGRRDGRIAARTKPEIAWVGTGKEFDDVIEGAVEHLLDDWKAEKESVGKSGQKKDALEGRLAVDLYQKLQGLPAEILTDRGFWRYLAVHGLFDFVQWRDGETCRLVSFGAGSANSWDCVPHRMFNRALIARAAAAEDASDPFWGALVAGTDLWRSHVLRVLIGNAPLLVNEILADSLAGEMPSGVLRDTIKRLQRTRANVVFEVLDRGECRKLIDEHRSAAVSALEAAKVTE